MTTAAVGHIDEHPDPWTETEFWALPEDKGQRIELLDGSLLVSPAPKSGHQRITRRLANFLETGLPVGWEVLEGVNVRMAPGRVLIPDVAVVQARKDVVAYEAAEVVLVAEVVPPSTAVQDHVLKRSLYAAASIPRYLIVEADGDAPQRRALLFELGDDGYRPGEWTGAGEKLELDAPRVTIDCAELFRE